MAETVTVRLAGNYGFEWIERMVRDLQPLLNVQERVRIELDLGGLVFVGPTSLALLEATLKRLENEDLLEPGGIIIEPRSPLTSQYLHRMDFFAGLDSIEGIEEPFERRDPVGFRPCQGFATEDDYWRVAASLADALTERCKVEEIAQAAIRICLDELTENVVHHADSPVGGFAAAQGTPKKNRFEVGIADLGIGFRRSLIKNPNHADITSDAEAIETALRPFVTSTPARNAGIGLYITSRLLKSNGGSLVVRSGRGRLVAGVEEGTSEADVELPGAVVALRARTDRPLDIGEVYKEVEEIERDNGDRSDQTG